MSAYLCNDATFDLIVTAASDRKMSLWIPGEEGVSEDWQHDAPQFGGFRLEAKGNEQALWDCLYQANVKSVRARYGDDTDMVGSAAGAGFRRCILNHYMGTTPVAVAKSVHCLDYQSCEAEDWRESLACRWLAEILDSLWHMVPGYEDAAWGADRTDTHPTRDDEPAQLAARKARKADAEFQSRINVD
jgi:hypothetical protein